MNHWGASRTPFFFFIFYGGDKACLFPLSCPEEGIYFSLPNAEWRGDLSLVYTEKRPDSVSYFEAQPMSFSCYQKKFTQVQYHLARGDTYLLNLTTETPVQTNISLTQFFNEASSSFKFMWENNFVCFSPEAFVSIEDNIIKTFPMKGTISAAQEGALDLLLSNEKESREHATIVDLLRNDLSLVAENIRVERYRYGERLMTHKGEIYQVSSEIAGDLPDGWENQLGDMMDKLLPAGSVTGAPKDWTCRIIDAVEGYSRGGYTGVFGCYDGVGLKSAVAIRFLEKTAQGMVYKSGGGVTALSQVEEEYQELIQKIYVPFVF